MRGVRFVVMLVVALVVSSFAMPAHAAIAKAQAPLSGPSAVRQRWRVTAKMYMRDGSYRLVYITWNGLAETIDWPSAAVCEYLTYRFWSPWERAGARFEVTSKPVLDLETPINGG